MSGQGEAALGGVGELSEDSKKMIAENSFMSDNHKKTIYTVNKRDQTVKGDIGGEISYKNTEHYKFFDELPVKGGIVQEGEVFYVKGTLRDYFPGILKEIESRFKELKTGAGTGTGAVARPGGGSRRRRPSRKYKKSKRVLRRKSRSSRRR